MTTNIEKLLAFDTTEFDVTNTKAILTEAFTRALQLLEDQEHVCAMSLLSPESISKLDSLAANILPFLELEYKKN